MNNKKRTAAEAMDDAIIRGIAAGLKPLELLDSVNVAYNGILRTRQAFYAKLPPLPEPVQIFDHDAGMYATVFQTRDGELGGMPVEMVREQAPEFYAQALAYKRAYDLALTEA